MKKLTRKKVTLEIEFNSFNELEFVLNKVLGMSKQHQRHERQSIAGSIYEYSFEVLESESDFREEIINGQRCLVIKSKMN
jgi:hypothetical protein